MQFRMGAAMSQTMSAADAVVRVLEAEGVEYVFGIPGAHILPFYDAIARSDRITAVLSKHEGGAAFMAGMYSRATGKPSVCVGTAGPGAINFATGIADAYVENIPVILVTGQVPTDVIGMNGDQEGSGEPGTPDQVQMYRSMTRASSLVQRADRAVFKMREAFRLALAEPYGPVHVCFPADVLGQQVDYQALDPAQYRVTGSALVDHRAVAKAADLIAVSRRPVIVVGHRARLPDASAEIVRLAERFDIPVATTVVSKSLISEHHPLSLGVLHLFGHRLPNKVLKVSDCVIAVGENFMQAVTHHYDPELLPSGRLVQIDCCTSQMGKIYPMAVGVPGTIRTSVARLHEELESRDYRAEFVATELEGLKLETRHFSESEMTSDDDVFKPQRLMWEIGENLPENAVIQVDIGQNFFWTLRYLRARQGNYFGTWGIQSMGVGAAGCVGLALARPGQRVVCICGDGSMQMNGAEFGAAQSMGLPITWVVVNDHRLNMVHFAQGFSFGERYIATTMQSPDFSKWAKAYGAPGFSVAHARDLKAALQAAWDCPGPSLVQVSVDADEIPPIKPRTLLLAKEMGLDLSDSKVTARAFRKVLDER